MPADAIRAVVPPGCHRPPEAAPAPGEDAGDAVLVLGPWRARCTPRHLLPSFSALWPSQPTFRFELSGYRDGAWTPWVATATLGSGGFAPAPAAAAGLAVDVDVCEITEPVEAVRLRLRIAREDAPAVLSRPWLLTLSACDLQPSLAAPAAPTGTAEGGGGVPRRARPALDVPRRSQMIEDPRIASRICSPTSVGMVLAYLGIEDSTARVAADVLHPALDRYGIWPAAIAAAARRGALGYLLRFPDWAAAAWCLERGLPVIASVRYGRGELRDAPMPETSGHLLVITGHEGNEVLVNDPAAPAPDTVCRRYALDEFTRAWLHRTGIGYILFRDSLLGGAPNAPPSPPWRRAAARGTPAEPGRPSVTRFVHGPVRPGGLGGHG